ncbi:UNVERIFIED_CONTAM: hypothetical protein FKN15_055600 [Acipenser sinensis]
METGERATRAEADRAGAADSEALLSPEPEEEETLPSPEQWATIKEEEVKSTPPPQLKPPPLTARLAPESVDPCPVLRDTLPKAPDLPSLDLEPRSVLHQAQFLAWFTTVLPLQPQTSRCRWQTSFGLPLPVAVLPLAVQRSLCRDPSLKLCLLHHPPGL